MKGFLNSMLALAFIAGASADVSALSWDNQKDAALPQSSRRVVMMGNSITEYWLGHDVNNHKEFFSENGALDRGIAAQQTPAMIRRFQDDVVSLHPLVTVIAGGVNDLNDKSSVDEVFENTLKMVAMAQEAGIKPILATVNPSGWSKERVDKYIAYNKKVKEYCDKTGIPFCNYFDAVTMGTPLGGFRYVGDYNEMKFDFRGRADHSDHLHPGRKGYMAMESVVIPLIESSIWNGNTYEAEHAVKFGPSAADRKMAKASGGVVVDNLGNGSYLSLGYTAPLAGNYDFTVKYSSASDSKLALKVGDDIYSVDCPSTSGGVGEASVRLTLHKGFNRITVADQDSAAPQVDAFVMKDLTLSDLYPTFSVLGDSYSTYRDHIDTRVEFQGSGCEYPQAKYDLESVDDTWWKQFEAATGCSLVQNNSISGTTMSYISLNGSGATKPVSFVNRVTKMDKADLFIIEGGTNDFIGGRTSYSKAKDESINGLPIVGDYKWDGFDADMPDYRFVRPAVAYMISYLQTTYPGCTVVFMANDKIPAEGKESFRNICDHYGAVYYEMHDIERSVDNPHPLKAGMTAICSQLIEALQQANGIKNPGSLVPTTPSQAPDYYCTWNLQGFVSGHKFGAGSNDFRSEMNEDNMFGTNNVYPAGEVKHVDGVEYVVDTRHQGWLDHFPSIHQDLTFVMDDSWDIPAESNSKRPHGTNYDNEHLALLTIDPSRFPSFSGKDQERMAKLVAAVKEKGWKGLGGWICAQNPINLTKKYTGKQNTLENSKNWTAKQEEKYWKTRLKESQDAGFLYWKVDWGNKDRDDEFRRNLSKWGREVAPDVVIEHASFQDGGPHKPYYINFSEVLRTYDVRADLSQAQTISRVAEVLGIGKAERENWGIINCEDEAYIAAGLGCAIGIMRHPYVGDLPSGKTDGTFQAGNRRMKNRLNEIVRAVRWHRIATPFSADGKFTVSDEMLFDSNPRSSYEAPARVSRRMPLPEILGVDALNEEKPYVLASLYDNECASVAVINRLIDGDYKQHKVDVKVQPKRWDRKVGIFGHYHSLTLDYQGGLPEGEFKVFAQDLASDDAPVEIPYIVSSNGKGIVIAGSTIENLCKDNRYAYSEVTHIDADYTDLSDPGIVLLVVAE